MPSQDQFHEDHPRTNSWLEESEPSPATRKTRPGSSPASATVRDRSRTEHVSASRLQQLAAQLGLTEEQLAERIPADTIRRLKFPVLEQEDPATGLSRFEHDKGVVRDARTPLLAGDQAHEAIPKGSNGRGAGIGTGRSDVTGRFTK